LRTPEYPEKNPENPDFSETPEISSEIPDLSGTALRVP
jgi:hypothetical protein